MNMRENKMFEVKKARTERLHRSAVVTMQRLLNKDDSDKRKIFRQINDMTLSQ